MGGADLLRQYLAAGLVHEFHADDRAGIESPFATHLRFRVRRGEQSIGPENAGATDLQTP